MAQPWRVLPNTTELKFSAETKSSLLVGLYNIQGIYTFKHYDMCMEPQHVGEFEVQNRTQKKGIESGLRFT